MFHINFYASLNFYELKVLIKKKVIFMSIFEEHFLMILLK